MARWEPEVENYLGFPEALSGQSLLERGRAQVRRFGIQIVEGRVERVTRDGETGSCSQAALLLTGAGASCWRPDSPICCPRSREPRPV